jgi:hypothetical protein
MRRDPPSDNLTEQGTNEHCTVFLKALTTRLHLRGGCEGEPAPQVNAHCAFRRRSQRRQPRQVQAGVSTAHAAPPAPPPQTCPGDKATHPKTERHRSQNQPRNHHPSIPQLTTTAHKPTNLADRPTTPANISTTSPQRQSAQWLNLHVTKAQNQRRYLHPLPAMEHQEELASSFHPKLQLSPHYGLRPPRCPTSHDYAAMLKTASSSAPSSSLRINAPFDFQSAPPATTTLQR